MSSCSIIFSVIPICDSECPFIICSKVGDCVHRIFNCKHELLKKCLTLANYEFTVAEILSAHLGKDIVDGKVEIVYCCFSLRTSCYYNRFMLHQTLTLIF